MKYISILTLVILSVVLADRHAIIIAPRANWNDYSVQSEGCRMYKNLIAGGMKAGNIIMMSTEATSASPNNPFPGELFTDNSPDAPGKDYSHGCIEHIDYEEKEMTGSVMLAIMRGDVAELRKLTGKENPRALQSTAEDEVVLYFTSHGDYGSIYVGDTTVKDTQLLETLNYMHRNNLYKHLLLLIEACYSGSMFEKLPTDMNILVLTATDAAHVSYMSHCPPNDDMIDGKKLQTCLSCYWDNAMDWYMEGEVEHTLDELHEHIHEIVKYHGQNSSKWGDVKGMGGMTIHHFMGDIPKGRFGGMKNESDSIVAKPDVPAHLAKWRAIRADKSSNENALAEYQKIVFENAKREVEVMRLGVALMNEKAANKALNTPAESYSVSCIRDLSSSLVEKCGHSYPFSEKTMNMLRNICLPGLSVPNVNYNNICL